MPPRHDPPLFVIGASAGGVEALTRLVRGLPRGFPAPIAIVLHVPATGTSVLPTILGRSGRLPAVAAEDGMPLVAGVIHVAPPDRHLIVVDGELGLTSGPRESGHRPAVDPLFASAARSCGARAIGVILSGSLDDGAAGLAAIKLHGGVAVVQDPDDALYRGMPDNALARTSVDHVVAIGDMAGLFVELASGGVDRPEPVPAAAGDGPQIASGG